MSTPTTEEALELRRASWAAQASEAVAGMGPACVAEREARELARRWATSRLMPALQMSQGLAGAERERLYAWVQTYAAEASAEGLDAADIAANLAIELNLGTGETFDEDAARELLKSAGWPS